MKHFLSEIKDISQSKGHKPKFKDRLQIAKAQGLIEFFS